MVMFSLWLTPPSPIFEEFACLIAELGSAHNSHSFLPHITLLGRIRGDLALHKELFYKLSEQISSIPINLWKADYSDDFFRCVFITVEETPQLLNAFKTAKSVFGLQSNSHYTPHLSLVYGKLPKAQKEAIVQKIGDKFSRKFIINKLNLVSVQGTPNRWRTVFEAALG